MKKTKYMSLVIVAMIAIATIAISIPQVAAAPTTIEKSPTAYSPDTGGWTWPERVTDTSQTNYAYARTAVSEAYSGFGFDIPSSSITSVVLTLKTAKVTLETMTMDVQVSVNGGTDYLPVGTITLRSYINAPNTDTFILTDILTSITWTPSQLNNDQIKVKVIDTGKFPVGYNTYTQYLYGINIAVTYDDQPNVVPEYALGGLGALAVTFAALVVFMKRSSIPSFKRQ